MRYWGSFIGFMLLATLAFPSLAQQKPPAPVSFAQLRENPQAHLGARVVLGGEIIRLAPAPQGFFIQVLQHPLGPGLEPDTFAFSGGLFWVEYPEEAPPPSIATPFITVMGEVIGSRQGHPLIRARRALLLPSAVSSPFSSMY